MNITSECDSESESGRNDSQSTIADSQATDELRGTTGYRRNGKIARLPRVVRETINELLDDGIEYEAIIAELGEDGEGLSKQNISNWVQGGYRDWVKEQERDALLRGNFDRVLDLLAKAEPEEVPDLVVKLFAARVGGVLSGLTPQELHDNSEKDPRNLVRLLSLVPKLSREALRTRKFRRSVARDEAAAPNSAEAKEKARVEFLDSMGQLFGIRPPRRRDQIAESPPEQNTHQPAPTT